jgi:hypothetical protein
MRKYSSVTKVNKVIDYLRVFGRPADEWLGGGWWVSDEAATGIKYLNIDFAYAYRKKWGQK